ncbi:hypothetical protein M1N05_01985 [Dehalococcoidales bacterium]|nr:hypothetical protein [Dehalococcoidales bacterium]MCL0091454.1 hypothetical protein [Dehalococcoidales bacterium]
MPIARYSYHQDKTSYLPEAPSETQYQTALAQEVASTKQNATTAMFKPKLGASHSMLSIPFLGSHQHITGEEKRQF